MGRNEIRIRRKSISSGRLARYRNYESLMARHERDQRIRRLSRLIVYVLIIVILICTLLGVYIIRTHPTPTPKSPKGDLNAPDSSGEGLGESVKLANALLTEEVK